MVGQPARVKTKMFVLHFNRRRRWQHFFGGLQPIGSVRFFIARGAALSPQAMAGDLLSKQIVASFGGQAVANIAEKSCQRPVVEYAFAATNIHRIVHRAIQRFTCK